MQTDKRRKPADANADQATLQCFEHNGSCPGAGTGTDWANNCYPHNAWSSGEGDGDRRYSIRLETGTPKIDPFPASIALGVRCVLDMNTLNKRTADKLCDIGALQEDPTCTKSKNFGKWSPATAPCYVPVTSTRGAVRAPIMVSVTRTAYGRPLWWKIAHTIEAFAWISWILPRQVYAVRQEITASVLVLASSLCAVSWI